MKKIIVLILVLALMAGFVTASDAYSPEKSDDQTLIVKGEAHGKVIEEIPQLGLKVVKGKLKDQVAAEWVEVDGTYRVCDDVQLVPNDPSFGLQWGMTKISAPDAWDEIAGNMSIRIAILDTGVDQDHEDLPPIVLQQNFSSSPDIDDHYGHGTHCAGIAAAATNNGVGVAGVAYAASLMNGKVLGDGGSGSWSWVASGIVWAADNGADVISMSLGGTGSSQAVEDAVNYAWDHGVVIVAAAGNNNDNQPFYPASYEKIIAVAATDQADNKASFSNYHWSWVDVAAPGVAVYSTLPNHGSNLGTDYGNLQGTSMACPHVAGLAALVEASGIATTNTDIRYRIERFCDEIPGTQDLWEYGRINAARAVDPSAEPNPPPPPRPPIPKPAMPPTCDTIGVTDITSGSVVLHGELLTMGDSTTVNVGVMVGKVGTNMMCGYINITLTEPGPFQQTLTSYCGTALQPDTLYGYRAAAKGDASKQYSYGADRYFYTLPETPEGPVAQFSGSPRQGQGPLTVIFTDLSTGGPTTWEWDFDNDGVPDSILQNPQYIYDIFGTYSVKLVVTNEFGEDEELKINYITVTPPPMAPVADFTADVTYGEKHLKVQFSDLSTNDPISWLWDFGDGKTSTDRNPSYFYKKDGEYTVTLTVSNASGSDTETKVGYIIVDPFVPPGKK